MQPKEERYTVKEISLATGISAGTLRSRRARLGMAANNEGYTYQQVQQLIKKPRIAAKFRKRKADELTLRLKNDGFV